MISSKKCSPEKIAFIRSVWMTPASNESIAKAVEVSIPTLVKWGKALNLPARMMFRDTIRNANKAARSEEMLMRLGNEVRLYPNEDEMKALHMAAMVRSIHIPTLVARIISTVIKDNMIDAVLDDADQTTTKAA